MMPSTRGGGLCAPARCNGEAAIQKEIEPRAADKMNTTPVGSKHGPRRRLDPFTPHQHDVQPVFSRQGRPSGLLAQRYEWIVTAIAGIVDLPIDKVQFPPALYPRERLDNEYIQRLRLNLNIDGLPSIKVNKEYLGIDGQ